MFKTVMKLAALQRLQTKNGKNNQTYTDVEKDFIWHVKQEFEKVYPEDDFKFDFLKDTTIKFYINNTEVGLVRLRTKRGMQVSKTEWFDIETKENFFEAKKKVSVWLEFYKNNI